MFIVQRKSFPNTLLLLLRAAASSGFDASSPSYSAERNLRGYLVAAIAPRQDGAARRLPELIRIHEMATADAAAGKWKTDTLSSLGTAMKGSQFQ